MSRLPQAVHEIKAPLTSGSVGLATWWDLLPISDKMSTVVLALTGVLTVVLIIKNLIEIFRGKKRKTKKGKHCERCDD